MPSNVHDVFTCPACGSAVPVSCSAGEAIVDHGCPLCGERVTETAIDRA